MNRQHILEEIKRTTEENGGVPLGMKTFLKETGIRVSDWKGRYWARWGDAVEEAGYQANTLNKPYGSDLLLEKLATLIRGLGKFPVTAEFKMKGRSEPGFPSYDAFMRLGNKQQLANMLTHWCESSGEWEDVREICAPLADRAEVNNTPTEDDVSVVMGYIYLLRSGKYYKIGRSNAPGRREYELAIQLPEPAREVHRIPTDDPVGVEKYWHNRFADRRKNGEWFELHRDDVLAFRRRKFL